MLTFEAIDFWHTDRYHGVERHLTGVHREISEAILKKGIKNLRIIDIGANTGKFVEMLQRDFIVDDVIFVEPLLSLVEYMKQHSFAKYKHFKFLNIALSSEESQMIVSEPSNDNLGGGKLEIGLGVHSIGYPVRVARFDNVPELMNFKPNIIKIDAEGHDLKILSTMVNFIGNLEEKPIMIFEMTSRYGYDAEQTNEIIELSKLYEAFGYNPIRLDWESSHDELLFV